MGIKSFIGTKAFYKYAISLAIPVFIQQMITNFVSLLDNIMVGQVGTEAMSGVAIANTLIFVFNLCIFGGVSGPGIFSAQFHGKENHKGVRDCLRYKFILVFSLTVLAEALIFFLHTPLINFYLHDVNSGNIAETFKAAKEYLFIMALGLPPFALCNAYAGTLRETGETALPMKAGVIAVLVNLLFNYLLIFGKFGFPELGVAGAAIATVVSRYVEFFIVCIATHTNSIKYKFIKGVYKTFKIPKQLVKDITVKGLPLILNETCWAAGISTLTGCYSMRGLSVVAGFNIAQTITNLFNVGFISFGTVIAIMIGNQLGAGKLKEAREDAKKLIVLSVSVSTVIGLIAVITAKLFPLLYNTTDEVRNIAAIIIMISAAFTPVNAFVHACYFTIRSGGKTYITFLFDSVFEWIVCVPVAFVIASYTNMHIFFLFFIVQMMVFIKAIIGGILVSKGIWVNNLTD